jgi:hypothetical protein
MHACKLVVAMAILVGTTAIENAALAVVLFAKKLLSEPRRHAYKDSEEVIC